MSRRYWFARRRSADVGKPSRVGGFSPISWEGWSMIAVFAGAMALGGFIWFESATQGLSQGWVGFVLLSVIGSGLLLASVGMNADPDHTVDDYRTGRVKNGSTKRV